MNFNNYSKPYSDSIKDGWIDQLLGDGFCSGELEDFTEFRLYNDLVPLDVMKKEERDEHLFKKPHCICMVLDFSSNALNKWDIQPIRLSGAKILLEMFIVNFFGRNVDGQLALILTNGDYVQVLTDLSENKELHLTALERLDSFPLLKQPSMNNGLHLALEMLNEVTYAASREIFLITGSYDTSSIIPDKVNAVWLSCSGISLTEGDDNFELEIQCSYVAEFSVIEDRDQLLVNFESMLTVQLQGDPNGWEE